MSSNANTTPPVPKREEKRVVYVGAAPKDWDPSVPRQARGSQEPLLDPPVAIPDPYGWMRDEYRTDQHVLHYLQLENEYTEQMTRHLKEFKDQIYEEMVGYLEETDYTVPRPRQDYVYYQRTFKGQSYSRHVRAPRSNFIDAQSIQWTPANSAEPVVPGEEVVLDVNALALGKSYCGVGSLAISPSQSLLAYAVDFTGDEVCKVFVKRLGTDEVIDHDPAIECSGNLVWGNDDSTLYYLAMDYNQRPYQLYRRRIMCSSEDELLFQDDDDMFYSHISNSLDNKYLLLEIVSKETSEIWYLDLHHPESQLQCIAERRSKVLYFATPRHDKWWIATNYGGTPNMQLMTCPIGGDASQWKPVVDLHNKPLLDGGYARSLESIFTFDSHVVLYGREEGLPRIWVLDPDSMALTRLEFDEKAHQVELGLNHEFASSSIAVTYNSMVTPPQTLEINLANPTRRRVLKRNFVPNYDLSHFACDRLTVLSRDGKTQIPISLVYRKDIMQKNIQDGTPMHTHMYGYGSYGQSIAADFRSTRLPLLNRGVVYVIAHVRGGGEMGRQWYEEPNGAKYLCKKNSFNDFIDVAKWLIYDRKLTTADRLSCKGRSAGGLLIGGSINQAPELFKCAMLIVPFVDAIVTMSDASIPLTALEWLEHGNPNELKYHRYMMEYCPLQNVKKGAKYPSCWLRAGLHDPRVQYWEPAKFAATLRHMVSPESGPVCLKVDLSAGHFSASDRYKFLDELAWDDAFLLDQLGLIEK